MPQRCGRRRWGGRWGGASVTVGVVVGLLAATRAVGQGQYIPWGLVPTIETSPTALEAPPLGCTCVVTASPCTTYRCGCVCNVMAGACDPNCCCDTECAAEDVARFRAAGACRPEGPVNITLRTCIDTGTDQSLSTVNPVSRMTVERTPGMERVLCISVDNTPLKGTYLVDPGAKDPALLSDPAIARAHSYATVTRPTTTSTATLYNVGDSIPVAVQDGATLRSAGSGVWSLPFPATLTTADWTLGATVAAVSAVQTGGLSSAAGVGSGGSGGGGAASAASSQCLRDGVGGSPVAFRQPVPLTKCTTTLALTDATCEALSAARLTQSLRLGRSPRASVSDPTTFLSVSLGAVYVAHGGNGSLTLADAATAAALLNGAALVTTATACTCTSAVVGISYRAEYNAATGTLTAIAADVVVSDITAPLAVCTAGTGVTVPLAVTVQWAPDAATRATIATSTTASNAVPSQRSGNPGYVTGAPVLAGAMTTASGVDSSLATPTDKRAVARSAQPSLAGVLTAAAVNSTGLGGGAFGLYLRGPRPDGSCAAYPSGPTGAPLSLVPVDTAMPVPVTFNEDAVVGCALTFTPAAFQAWCSGAPSAPLQYVGLGGVDVTGSGAWNTWAARTAFTHVGTLGNADPLKPWQWLRIDTPATLPTPSYDANTGSCTNLITGVHLEFLTGRVGEALNPQERILAVRMKYALDTWRYGREDVRTHVASVGGATFLMRSTVTWTSIAPLRQDFVPPAPPVIPTLPSDLFFPFVTTTSTADQQLTVSGAHSVGGGAPLIALVLAVVMALVAGAWAMD